VSNSYVSAIRVNVRRTQIRLTRTAQRYSYEEIVEVGIEEKFGAVTLSVTMTISQSQVIRDIISMMCFLVR
jgi:hypothetical protein